MCVWQSGPDLVSFSQVRLFLCRFCGFQAHSDGETCSISAMCCEAFANMLKESELSFSMLQNAPVSGVTSTTF